jgi:hypothetical protein
VAGESIEGLPGGRWGSRQSCVGRAPSTTIPRTSGIKRNTLPRDARHIPAAFEDNAKLMTQSFCKQIHECEFLRALPFQK